MLVDAKGYLTREGWEAFGFEAHGKVPGFYYHRELGLEFDMNAARSPAGFVKWVFVMGKAEGSREKLRQIQRMLGVL